MVRLRGWCCRLIPCGGREGFRWVTKRVIVEGRTAYIRTGLEERCVLVVEMSLEVAVEMHQGCLKSGEV